MEKIVRKILKYNPDMALKPERDEFMANVIALSLFLLSKKTNYNFPDNCAKVIFKKLYENNAAQYDSVNRELNLDKNIFLFGEDYTSDLPLIAHEICHLARDYSGKIKQKNSTYFQTDELVPFFKKLKNFNSRKKLVSKDDFKTIGKYLDTFYYLQDYEFEAYCFGVEFLNTIITIGDTLDLDEDEKQTLFNITYDSNIVPFVDKLKEFKRIRQDKKVAKQIKILSNAFFTDFFKKHPNWKKEFLNSSLKDDVPYTLFSCLIPSLMFDYNDTLAHDYFNLLAQCKFDLASQEILFLVQKTKIQLTKAEEVIFNKFLKQYNKESETSITYDIVKSEKVRLQKENDRLAGISTM